ncbi:MAG: hypothetical protein MZV70_37425 [Desulfobacterales bacterium]|nr:hypothetical protein [Desulfobacterales bacterium]
MSGWIPRVRVPLGFVIPQLGPRGAAGPLREESMAATASSRERDLRPGRHRRQRYRTEPGRRPARRALWRRAARGPAPAVEAPQGPARRRGQSGLIFVVRERLVELRILVGPIAGAALIHDIHIGVARHLPLGQKAATSSVPAMPPGSTRCRTRRPRCAIPCASVTRSPTGDASPSPPRGLPRRLSPSTTSGPTCAKPRSDGRIQAVVLRLGPLECDWAKANAVREAILDFRRSGKKVYALIEEAPIPTWSTSWPRPATGSSSIPWAGWGSTASAATSRS